MRGLRHTHTHHHFLQTLLRIMFEWKWRFAFWLWIFLARAPSALREQKAVTNDLVSLAIMQAVACAQSLDIHWDAACPPLTSEASSCRWNDRSPTRNQDTFRYFLGYFRSSMCSEFAVLAKHLAEVSKRVCDLDKYAFAILNAIFPLMQGVIPLLSWFYTLKLLLTMCKYRLN